VLEDCWGWIAGRILDRLDAGDHVAFLLDPVDGARHRPAERNLGFQGVKDMAPGHEA
jgi:flavin reductase (DIM6/NTAB) family NADH-FMN oxidoreductase RutF